MEKDCIYWEYGEYGLYMGDRLLSYVESITFRHYQVASIGVWDSIAWHNDWIVPDTQAYWLRRIVYSCCCKKTYLVIHSLFIKMFIADPTKELWKTEDEGPGESNLQQCHNKGSQLYSLAATEHVSVPIGQKSL